MKLSVRLLRSTGVKAGPWLVICGVRSLNWAYRVRLGRQILGRSHECEITIDHRSVSRRHAEITFDGKTQQIADLQSANGTFINGKPVARAAFEVGDTIRLGQVTLDVVATLESARAYFDDEETESLADDGPDIVAAVSEFISPTDGKVLKLLLKGLSEKAVATDLDLSEQTVHWRIKRIYRSLGVHSRSELFALLTKPRE